MNDDLITLEQKKQLQIDAGIPHLPTHLTYECRIAIAGEGERAYDWSDKPHRLVYDLSRQVEADADRIEQLNERLTAATDDAKEAEAYAEQLEAKLTKAVETLRPFADVLKSNYFHQPDTLPISMGFGHYDRRWTLKLMDFRNARTVLAELEKTE